MHIDVRVLFGLVPGILGKICDWDSRLAWRERLATILLQSVLTRHPHFPSIDTPSLICGGQQRHCKRESKTGTTDFGG